MAPGTATVWVPERETHVTAACEYSPINRRGGRGAPPTRRPRRPGESTVEHGGAPRVPIPSQEPKPVRSLAQRHHQVVGLLGQYGR
jgi:hypothetical protein